MVGVEDLVFVYQNADTAILLGLSFGVYVVWKREVQPRLLNLEQTQEERKEKWAEQHLSGQERDILLDDAHGRIDAVEKAVSRLRARLQTLENGVAAETGFHEPVDGDFYRGGDRDRGDPDVSPDGGQVKDVDPDDSPTARSKRQRQAQASVTNDVDIDGVSAQQDPDSQQDRPDDRRGRGPSPS